MWTSMWECWRRTVFSGLRRQWPSWVSKSIWNSSWEPLLSEDKINFIKCSRHLKLLDSIVESIPSWWCCLGRFSYWELLVHSKAYWQGWGFYEVVALCIIVVSNRRLLMPTNFLGAYSCCYYYTSGCFTSTIESASRTSMGSTRPKIGTSWLSKLYFLLIDWRWLSTASCSWSILYPARDRSFSPTYISLGTFSIWNNFWAAVGTCNLRASFREKSIDLFEFYSLSLARTTSDCEL